MAASVGTFVPPDIDWALLAPVVSVLGAAVLGVLVEAFVPRGARYAAQLLVAVAGIVGSLAAVVALWGSQASTAAGTLVVDGPTLFLQGTIGVLSLLAVLTVAERSPQAGDAFAPQAAAIPGSPAEDAARRAGARQTEVFPLLMFAVGGMLLFPASGDLLTMFVALEVLSLPLYLMCGLARRRRLLSQESSLKYFLLGAFSSAFFLYGAALLYGYAGSVRLADIAAAVPTRVGEDGLLLAGTALLAVGLLFKIGAVPFHAWTPDVYQGAPTPVTGFMAACTKVAAFGALLRVLYVALPGARWDWQPALWAVAIATMLLGAVVAIVQTDVKRMLAYSSIAHAGFLLVGVLAMTSAGISGTLFYLLAYGLATIGAFAVVTLVRDSGGEATHLSQWAGLGRRSPVLAAAFTLFLISFAGLPLTGGFTGKVAVFSAAAAGGAGLLVVVGVVASAIAAAFYVRVVVVMYFSEPTPGSTTTVAAASPMTATAVAVGAAATLALGLGPAPVLQLAAQASVFLP